jgi:hypothetical protein
MSPILLLTAQFKRTLSFYLNGKTADCQTVPVRTGLFNLGPGDGNMAGWFVTVGKQPGGVGKW